MGPPRTFCLLRIAKVRVALGAVPHDVDRTNETDLVWERRVDIVPPPVLVRGTNTIEPPAKSGEHEWQVGPALEDVDRRPVAHEVADEVDGSAGEGFVE